VLNGLAPRRGRAGGAAGERVEATADAADAVATDVDVQVTPGAASAQDSTV
jgi:hypothetical protein